MKYLKIYLDFLTFLSSSDNPKTYGEVMSALSINKPQFEKVMKHLQKYYENVGHKKGDEHNWQSHLIEINHEGILYLQKLEQNTTPNNSLHENNSSNLISVFSNKLTKILNGEDKFFKEFPYLKAPVIILTASILILVYIGAILFLSKGISYLLSLLNMPFADHIAVGLAIFVLIISIITYLKNTKRREK